MLCSVKLINILAKYLKKSCERIHFSKVVGFNMKLYLNMNSFTDIFQCYYFLDFKKSFCPEQLLMAASMTLKHEMQCTKSLYYLD